MGGEFGGVSVWVAVCVAVVWGDGVKKFKCLARLFKFTCGNAFPTVSKRDRIPSAVFSSFRTKVEKKYDRLHMV